jgi:O-antigen/teichoic acid export membrane protein
LGCILRFSGGATLRNDLDNSNALCKAKSHGPQNLTLMSAQAAGSGKRILKNSGWLLSPKIIAAILSLFYLALIARSLGPANFGRFALMFSFAQSAAGIAAFQTWQVIIRYGTQPVLDKRHDLIARLVYLCLLLDVVALLLGTVLTVAGLGILSPRLGWNHGVQLQIFVLAFLLMLANRSTATGLLRLFDDFKTGAFVDSLVPILRFFGVLLVYFSGPTALKFLIIWVASECVPTLCVWVIIIWRTHLSFRDLKFSDTASYVAAFPDFIGYAFWSSVNSSLRFMNQQIIVVIVGFFTNAESAGFFRLGHQLGQVLVRISDGLSLAFFMEFAKVDAASGGQGGGSLVRRTIIITAISAVIVFALLLLGGRPALQLIFGEQFLPAFPFILILGAAAAVQVGAMAFEPVLMARGHASLAMYPNLAGALSTILFLALLLPRYGALGAAIAVLVSTIVFAITMALAFSRTQRATAL